MGSNPESFSFCMLAGQLGLILGRTSHKCQRLMTLGARRDGKKSHQAEKIEDQPLGHGLLSLMFPSLTASNW